MARQLSALDMLRYYASDYVRDYASVRDDYDLLLRPSSPAKFVR